MKTHYCTNKKLHKIKTIILTINEINKEHCKNNSGYEKKKFP